MGNIRSYNKFLSFLFMIVFITPIVIKATHHLYIDHDCCTDQNYCNPDGNHNSEKNTEEDDDDCPICNYNLSINNLPENHSLNAEIHLFTRIYKDITTQQQYKLVISVKTPRAPPIPTYQEAV